MDWGRDGFLNVPVWSKGQVVRIDPSSGEVEVVVMVLVGPPQYDSTRMVVYTLSII